MAYGKISEFVSSFTKDGARPNLFHIELGGTDSSFQFRAEASAIPGSSIGIATASYFGRMAKFPGNRTFDNWTIQVIVDEKDYEVGGTRSYFEKWMQNLNGHVSNKRADNFSDPSSYQQSGSVIHWNKEGDTKIATYNMIGCFPIDVSPISLSWDADNQIERFSVTFAMQWWERTDVTDAP